MQFTGAIALVHPVRRSRGVFITGVSRAVAPGLWVNTLVRRYGAAGFFVKRLPRNPFIFGCIRATAVMQYPRNPTVNRPRPD